MTKNDQPAPGRVKEVLEASASGETSSRRQRLAIDHRNPRPLLFEIAWEVCQQVGGIYTVLRSKAPSMVKTWGKRYTLIGPWNPQTSTLEFEEDEPTGTVGAVIEQMRRKGLEVHYGRWLVSGQPQCILMNPASGMGNLAEAKYLLWEQHDIALPTTDALLDPVVAFGWMVEQFFRLLMGHKGLRRPVVGHFHEWMGASAIPELRRADLPMSIIFLTHATQLGRFLAMNDPWFYDHVPFVDWLADARRYNIEAQVRLERAAAHGAHLFTTVSNVTALECEHLLGRKPDKVLPNGLNIERFVAMHEFQNLHRVYKEKIHQFVMAQFFPSYTFDLDQTLYVFTSGRFEYRNKGFDLTLEALARLNARLRASRQGRTVVFFLISKRPFKGMNWNVLHRQAMLEEIRRNAEAIRDDFVERLVTETAAGRTPDYNDLVEDFWKLRLRRLMHAWKTRNLPLIVTHDLEDDANDDVLKQLRYLGLVNRPEDPVKVVYHPDFISSASPLFGLDYDQFVRGCHLGIFPSFYEPWGYTPLECVARGVPAVTSDLAGFGSYLLAEGGKNPERRGVFVVHRRYSSFDRSASQLADWLHTFCGLTRRQRIALRNRVENSAEQFDWEVLGRHYQDAVRQVRQNTGR